MAPRFEVAPGYFSNSISQISTPPYVTISPSSGAAGQGVTASGAGFAAGEQVDVAYKTGLKKPNPKTVNVCSAVASPLGDFTCTGAIPLGANAGGVHEITATGETSHSSANTGFTLTP
jgi:hypothetical protein